MTVQWHKAFTGSSYSSYSRHNSINKTERTNNDANRNVLSLKEGRPRNTLDEKNKGLMFFRKRNRASRYDCNLCGAFAI